MAIISEPSFSFYYSVSIRILSSKHKFDNFSNESFGLSINTAESRAHVIFYFTFYCVTVCDNSQRMISLFLRSCKYYICDWFRMLLYYPAFARNKHVVHHVISFLLTKPGRAYSWIARQLQVGRTLAFLLARSNFKSETSFGFLSPDYTGQPTWFVM